MVTFAEMNTESLFQERQKQFTDAEQLAQQHYNQLALWRFVWFLLTIAAIWWLNNTGNTLAATGTFLAGLIVFGWMLKRHQAIRRRRDLNHHLAFVNQDEAGRLHRQYLRPETGEAFLTPTHAYAGDLDIFGKHSLYRLLNRTHTYDGSYRLANWLLTPAPPQLTYVRQQAVEELEPQLDWRQNAEALAYLSEKTGQSPAKMRQWVLEDNALPLYLLAARFVLPLITLGVTAAWMTGYLPGWAVLASLGLHGLLLGQTNELAKAVSEQTHEMAEALQTFQDLFQHTESVKGFSPLLKSIRDNLSAGPRPASAAVGKLARLVENFNFRQNPYFYLFFALPTLWDIHYLHGLNRWRNRYRKHLNLWFDALAEMEALNSLAGFAYAHPTYVVPDIIDEKIPHLEAVGASHPLLPPDKSVANSLELVGSGKTVLITGSNMSGKSTFLRTIAINTVLAQAGAVVSARRFGCSPMRVFTSMRTQDSLEESTSSFYAELKRLKTLLELTQGAETAIDNPTQKALTNQWPVFYFLDEILKGTNSADRHRGAEALIRQLHKTTASGFVSTHDLELGQMTDASDFVRNCHFQSDVRDGELHFDYTLYDGICRSFNASQLMQAIGIDMKPGPAH